MSKHISKDLIDQIRNIAPFQEVYRELLPAHYRERGNSQCPCGENHSNNDKVEAFEIKGGFGFCHARQCKSPSGNESWDVFDLWMKVRAVDFKTAVLELAARYGIEAPKKKPEWKLKTAYNYCDKDGVVLFQSCRPTDKDAGFKQRRPDGNNGWIWNMENTPHVLYRLPAVVQADTVWLCEGEKDADNLANLGLCGTTAPLGAGKWLGLCDKHRIHEALQGKTVYILPDNDQPGRDHAQDVAASLHGFAASVKIVELPGLSEKGDASDFIEKHGPDAKRLILELAAKALEYESKKSPRFGCYSCADLLDDDIPDVKWTIDGLLPEGLTVLAGSPKIGKSWLAFTIALSVASGERALSHFHCNRGRALYLALEDNRRRLRGRLFKMGQTDRSKVGNVFIETLAPKIHEPKGKQNLLDKLTAWLLEFPDAGLIVVDTLAKIKKSHKGNQGAYEADYEDIEGLQQLAASFSVSIVLVTHDRKEESTDPFKTITGSTGIVGAADAAWVLTRKRGENEGSLFISGRDIEERKGTLMFEKETGLWRWLGDSAELAMNNLSRDVRNAILEADKPLGPQEIAELIGCGTSGKNYERVKKHVQRMVDKGELEKSVGRGKYTLPPEDAYYGKSAAYQEWGTQEVHLDHI